MSLLQKFEKYFTIKIVVGQGAYEKCAYYNKIYPWQSIKYGWYFRYLTALLQCKFPHQRVELFRVDHCVCENQQHWIDIHKESKKRGLISSITKLENIKAKTPQNLFGDAWVDIDKKIQAKQKELQDIQNGLWNYWIPEDYINIVKQLLKS